MRHEELPSSPPPNHRPENSARKQTHHTLRVLPAAAAKYLQSGDHAMVLMADVSACPARRGSAAPRSPRTVTMPVTEPTAIMQPSGATASCTSAKWGKERGAGGEREKGGRGEGEMGERGRGEKGAGKTGKWCGGGGGVGKGVGFDPNMLKKQTKL